MSLTVLKRAAVAVVLLQLSVAFVSADHRRGKELLDTEDSDFFRCKQATRKSCCGSENSLKRFGDKDKAASDACYAEVAEKFSTATAARAPKQDLFSSEAVKITKKKQFCLHECIGKKNNLLAEDGSLNKTSISEYAMKSVFKEPWQKEVGQKSLNKCLEETYIPWPAEETENKCNPVYVQFQHCLWLEYESNCPNDKRKTSKKCEKTRNRYRMQKSTPN